ncbi:hypothetical protein Tco_0913204 [Tanacetum coccineum]
MASLSPAGSINGDTVGPTYDLDILSEVPHYDTYHENDMLNSVVQETEYTEHLVSNNDAYDELTSDGNVISYVDYMVTIENDVAQYVLPPEQDNAIILSVIEQMKIQVERCNTLFAEQVYWSPVSKPTPSVSVVKTTPTKVVPKKLPTTSMVKENIQKAKYHLDKFDTCIKNKTVNLVFMWEIGE